MRGPACLLPALLWLALVSGARAQAPQPLPAEVSWPQLLQLIRSRSPRLAAYRSQGKVAQSEIAVASVLPNPSLSYTGFGRIGNGSQYGTQHQIGVEQPLLIGGQRGANRRAARRRAEVVQAEIALSELELEGDALRAFVSLLAAQARLDELTQARGDVDRVSHTVHERVQAGAEAQYDASRVELESAQLDTRLAQAGAEVTEASAALAETLGFPGWTPHALGTLAPLGLDQSFAALWERARNKLPSLQAAQRRAWAAQSEIDVARAERWGVPSLSAGTLLTTDGGSAAAFIGLSAPLPLFNFGGAAIDRASAGLAAAEAERTAAEAQARATLRGSLSTLAARRSALVTYERGVSNRLPELRAMAETAYRSGTASLLELLDSVRSAIEVRLTRVDLVSQVMQAEVDVLAASGALDDARPGAPMTATTAPAPAVAPARRGQQHRQQP